MVFGRFHEPKIYYYAVSYAYHRFISCINCVNGRFVIIGLQ